MPFPFREVCDLLESLEKVESKGHGDGDTPKYKRIKEAVNKEISEWFNKHQTTIDALEDAGTLLSMLWPEKRMDRCMSIPCQRSGTHIIAVLGLGRRGDELSTKTYDNFAFSEMVGKIMAAAENPLPSPGNEVTVEEVDDAFNFLSIKCHPHPMGSGVKRVEPVMSWGGEYDVFRKLFKRFSSVEGKWFLRLLKRDIFPVAVPFEDTLSRVHFLLPTLYNLRKDFSVCCKEMKNPLLRDMPRRCARNEVPKYMKLASELLQPRLFFQITRPNFIKARSLAHAAKTAGRGKIALERKYDGEYCQIHIQLRPNMTPDIRFFSKSGRESTHDRRLLRWPINDAFGIHSSCGNPTFEDKLIVEGEMLVYSDVKKDFMEFSEIRKHVTRGGPGYYLGTWNDVKPDYATEHLCIVLYDILLKDDQSLITRPYHERRAILESITREKKGYVFLSEKTDIDLSEDPEGPLALKDAFARGCARNWEGHVIKPWNAPYLGLGGENTNGWIKLKKDYIPGLGDCMDVAILGYSKTKQRADTRRDLMYEHVYTYYMGYVTNAEAVKRTNCPPEFRIVDTVSHGLSQKERIEVNNLCKTRTQCIEILDKRTGFGRFICDVKNPPMQAIVWPPIIFEVVGGGFHKPSNQNYHVLRWPRITRLHLDRDYMSGRWNIPDFQDLQDMAEKAMSIPESQLSQEEMEWNARLGMTAWDPTTTKNKGKRLHEEETPSTESKKLRSDDVVIWRKFGAGREDESLSTQQETIRSQDSEEESPRLLLHQHTQKDDKMNGIEDQDCTADGKEAEGNPTGPVKTAQVETASGPNDASLSAPADQAAATEAISQQTSQTGNSPKPATTDTFKPSPLLGAQIFASPLVSMTPHLDKIVLEQHKATALHKLTNNQPANSLLPEPLGLTTLPKILIINAEWDADACKAQEILARYTGTKVFDIKALRHSDWRGQAREDGKPGEVDWSLFHMRTL